MASADPTLQTWGKNLRTFRERFTGQGDLRLTATDEPMTQRELGELLEPPVTQSTVSRWEDGLMEPRRHYKVQLAAVFHTDVTILFPIHMAVA